MRLSWRCLRFGGKKQVLEMAADDRHSIEDGANDPLLNVRHYTLRDKALLPVYSYGCFTLRYTLNSIGAIDCGARSRYSAV